MGGNCKLGIGQFWRGDKLGAAVDEERRWVRRLVMGEVNEVNMSLAVSAAVSRNDGLCDEGGRCDTMESDTEVCWLKTLCGGEGLNARVCGCVIGDGD